MILDTYRCNRCGEEDGPFEPGEESDHFITITEPCPHHGVHMSHFCGWECAMHACAGNLDREESWEENHAED